MMRIRISKRNVEREAATDAKAILGGLTPASARTDPIVFALRHAANIATTATYQRLESRQSLDESRSQAAKLLNAVCRLLDLRRLDQAIIDEGKAAVQGWLDALSQEN